MRNCPECGQKLWNSALRRNAGVCPFCGHYFSLSAYDRLDIVMDPGTFQELDAGMSTEDPLNFPGYPEKTKRQEKKTGLTDAIVTGEGRIDGIPVAVAVLDNRYFMGSMGCVVGEKVTRLVEYADQYHLPLIIFSSSGGARMQEGIFSLMQMAKTSAAIEQFSEHGGLYISCLTNPTTGGVTASFATLGDYTLAEPNALIGFAGPRVIEQTIHRKLPEGFQRSEYLEKHGFIDRIVSRPEMKSQISGILKLHAKRRTYLRGRFPDRMGTQVTGIFQKASPAVHSPREKVILARNIDRPHIDDFIEGIFEDFFEQKGDHLFDDDRSILGGVALFQGEPVTVIGHRKGHDGKSCMEYNFGMPKPEGYRKAMRIMRQAEKFGRPVITFIDTPGAYPGAGAEERGQGEAISRSLAQMSRLKVPVISVVTGEGNSGGALAIGMANRILMLENAVYSVLSPEGFASILWKDSSRAGEACELMKLTAQDLYRAKIADEIIREPEGGAQCDYETTFRNISDALKRTIGEFDRMTGKMVREDRLRKFRRIGQESRRTPGAEDLRSAIS